MSALLQSLAYQLLLRLLLPLFWLQGRKQDPQRWRERFGFGFGFGVGDSDGDSDSDSDSDGDAVGDAVGDGDECAGTQAGPRSSRPIWLHAASYGEAKAAALLIEAMRAQGYRGGWLVTTTTRTGGEAIAPYLKATDRHRYAPFDLPGAIRRVLTQVQPRALVVMEVEIWPNLWRACQQSGIPIVLANARLSATSAKRYRQLLPRVWQDTLGRASLVLAQSAAIARRFQDLGVAAEQIQVCGNLKYGFRSNAATLDAGRRLRLLLAGQVLAGQVLAGQEPAGQEQGEGRPVWLAASTHASEEQWVIECHQALLKQYPELLLVIAPRHPGRFDAAWQLCADSGLHAVRRTVHTDGHADAPAPLEASVQLYLADTLGELPAFYAACDLCLVAGSFVQVGGHNILEPAACLCPIIVGPDMRNFADMMQDFVAEGAVLQAQTVAELYPRIRQLLDDKPGALAQAGRARACLERYQDAASQQAKLLVSLVDRELNNRETPL
ncbi:MAG: 3-deoxy-D-manno-octulosonic-acid transferase [Motiliproteus sp.]|jgi:3-deoxy-D-manno-octulosonic-acid transferase